MKYSIAALFAFSILITSCTSGSGLPRADETTQSFYTPLGDKVFSDAWVSITDAVHSLMILKDGEIVYERYANGHSSDELHIMWSVSKSFTAFAVGLAAEEGLLDILDKVYSYFPEIKIPEKDMEWRQEMSIYDLLIMSSGLEETKLGEIIASSLNDRSELDWAEVSLTADMVFRPGERFYYNSLNTYILSAIVSKVTGKTVADYLDDKVFRHLQIKDWIWEESPQGFSAGGWGLYLRTEDLAKFGLLWMNKGVWNGHRIISEEWIAEATRCHILPHEGQTNGYGYQTWLYKHGSFRFHGSRGQIMMAIPEKGLILVATSAHNDDQIIINSFIETIYNQIS